MSPGSGGGEEKVLPDGVVACVPGMVDTSARVQEATRVSHQSTREGCCLAEHLRCIEDALSGGSEEDAESLQQSVFPFRYKGRRCMGNALHIAVMCENTAGVVNQLLERGANAQEPCCYTSFDKLSTAQPMHLAVQSGDARVLQALLDGGAEVDAWSERDGQQHFTPLHEAAFFRRPLLVRFLLEQLADVHSRNLEGMTPLHMAAKMGASEVAETLVRFSADLQVRDNCNRTALRVAVESGVFPPRRLHMLARWRIADIMVVAEHYPSAVAEFMQDLSRDSRLGDKASHGGSLVTRLQEDEKVTVDHWIELMTEAPEAGALLLEVMTVEPDEDSIFYHPLPTQAVVRELRCDYNQDDTWKFDVEKPEAGGARQWPEWHDHLAPSVGNPRRKRSTSKVGTESITDFHPSPSAILPVCRLGSSRKELNPVHIRQLKLKGMVCEDVLHVLASTPYLDIFKNQATQSILQYAWVTFVRRYYNAQLLHRVLEITVLTVWTFNEPYWHENKPWSRWKRRLCWSFVFVSSLRETLRELGEAYGYVYVLDDAAAYFLNIWNYADVAAIVLFNFFAWGSMAHLNLGNDPSVFASVALFRWIQLLYTFRAYRLGPLGIRSIIPILESLKEVGGMLIICVVTFVGFTHAFLALDQDSSKWQITMVNAFKLLFMSDGDGINAVLALGGAQNGLTVPFAFLVVAVFVFCISLLNLFIAVHGEAYAQANSNSMALQSRERASICLHCMLQPRWPLPRRWRWWLGRFGERRHRPLTSYWVLTAVAVVAYAGLLAVDELHPAVPSALLLLPAVLLGNTFLAQRPWESRKTAAHSLIWWCTPVHQNGHGPEAQQQPDLEEISQRLAYLEGCMETLLRDAQKAKRVGFPKHMADFSKTH